jgi:hypothetical protein
LPRGANAADEFLVGITALLDRSSRAAARNPPQLGEVVVCVLGDDRGDIELNFLATASRGRRRHLLLY